MSVLGHFIKGRKDRGKRAEIGPRWLQFCTQMMPTAPISPPCSYKGTIEGCESGYMLDNANSFDRGWLSCAGIRGWGEEGAGVLCVWITYAATGHTSRSMQFGWLAFTRPAANNYLQVHTKWSAETLQPCWAREA